MTHLTSVITTELFCITSILFSILTSLAEKPNLLLQTVLNSKVLLSCSPEGEKICSMIFYYEWGTPKMYKQLKILYFFCLQEYSHLGGLQRLKSPDSQVQL